MQIFASTNSQLTPLHLEFGGLAKKNRAGLLKNFLLRWQAKIGYGHHKLCKLIIKKVLPLPKQRGDSEKLATLIFLHRDPVTIANL